MKNLKKIIYATAIASGVTFLGLSVIARIKKASSVYDNELEEKNLF